jgi:hypothetical protein
METDLERRVGLTVGGVAVRLYTAVIFKDFVLVNDAEGGLAVQVESESETDGVLVLDCEREAPLALGVGVAVKDWVRENDCERDGVLWKVSVGVGLADKGVGVGV